MAATLLVTSTLISVADAPHATVRPAPPELDVLALTGFLAAVVLLVCWACQREGRQFVLGCALAGAVAAVYCVLQGAWPIGVVQAAWAAGALRRWWRAPANRIPRGRTYGTASRTMSGCRPRAARRRLTTSAVSVPNLA